MGNISSTYEYTIIVFLISIDANTPEDAFVQIGGKLGNLPNQLSPTAAMEIIWRLNVGCFVNNSD